MKRFLKQNIDLNLEAAIFGPSEGHNLGWIFCNQFGL